MAPFSSTVSPRSVRFIPPKSWLAIVSSEPCSWRIVESPNSGACVVEEQFGQLICTSSALDTAL